MIDLFAFIAILLLSFGFFFLAYACHTMFKYQSEIIEIMLKTDEAQNRQIKKIYLDLEFLEDRLKE